MTAGRSLARAIVWETRIDDDTPAMDARELLEMCGLVQPGGHEITEIDPDRPARIPDHPGRIPTAEPRPARMTTPPGLANLPPPAPPKPRKPIPMTAIDEIDRTATDAAEAYIAAVHADQMFIDPAYQRPLDKARARSMADAFDPTLVGVIDISDRGPEHRPRYAVINGQHRRAAVILAHPDGHHAPMVCTVHRGLSPTDEARLFHELDATTRRLTGWDRWHARLGAGDPAVQDVERVVREHGLTISPGQRDGYVGAVGALEGLYALGGPSLIDRTLNTLTAAFGKAWAAYLAPVLTGVGLVVHHYNIDPDRLDAALVKSTPQQLRAQAVAYRDLMPGQLPRLVAQVLVNRMNAGRGARLPDVRDQVPAGRLRPVRAA